MTAVGASDRGYMVGMYATSLRLDRRSRLEDENGRLRHGSQVMIGPTLSVVFVSFPCDTHRQRIW